MNNISDISSCWLPSDFAILTHPRTVDMVGRLHVTNNCIHAIDLCLHLKKNVKTEFKGDFIKYLSKRPIDIYHSTENGRMSHNFINVGSTST